MLAVVRMHLYRPTLYVALAALIPAGPGIACIPVSPQAAADADTPFLDAYRSAEPLTTWPLKRILHEIPELKGLKSAADQSALPATLVQAAANLETFWMNFQNTSSVETIDESRRLRRANAGAEPETDDAVQRFRYLMLTDPDNPLRIKEYRTDLQGRERNSEAVSGFLRTSGFTSLPLIFGSGEQPLTAYRDLGSQTLRGRLCRVLAFAQHVDPAAMSRWEIAGQQIPILVQGIAWIDPARGQVVQMRTDLLAPQPRATLGRATTLVKFAPVEFRRSHGVLWLPSEVTVTVDLEAYTFINRHRYSEYQVFTVSTGGKAPQASER